ncbi:tRNA (adenosine(37)-N6)-threonylcarbamoyltransferase complex ATPase subunit type 1 TsaE [Pedobacter sandarakinus]|uniref:tRNA (adenosine(37)-N6)-threonylcarbamoyltransferase complex ATPase subunit type 1 TsaE n=1 Tax=Pedobacter sandarakinus TaxID=353156 RepID=UPI0022484946|nr:tRNA (adenosine(37)-N6)-threonylcarbamoyltransferase complex ATPase subunit type 1 TsaE [Pedobacter sandarakinus]MCX2573796.1 tRNA (adenosine(37)-N6)-threonylcarbamoyltransferase complex ATPase subunit type 1 TsaE [Pedobacter sandarakinus]
MDIAVNNLTDLPEVAKQLLAFAGEEKIFIFDGDMGAGKTTFIKVFCSIMGIEDVVSSPTYSIVNEYGSANDLVYHFDFYRIKNIQEAYDLGYEEYFYGGGICLIEWPERVAELLPDRYVKVAITVVDENRRLFRFSKAEN